MGSGTGCYLIALFAFLSNPPEDIVRDRVDLVEVNHFFDEAGNPKFDQVIYYRWSKERGRYDVVDYKQLSCRNQIPVRIGKLDGYLAIWHDKTDHYVLRAVHSRAMIETWTQHDPEMVERKYLPKDRRAELPSLVDMRSKATQQR